MNRISSAEDCPAKSGSVQLINAATAAHFFDLPSFYKEAERVLCKNGVVALSCYYLPTLVHPTKSDQFREALLDVKTIFTILNFTIDMFTQNYVIFIAYSLDIVRN